MSAGLSQFVGTSGRLVRGAWVLLLWFSRGLTAHAPCGTVHPRTPTHPPTHTHPHPHTHTHTHTYIYIWIRTQMKLALCSFSLTDLTSQQQAQRLSLLCTYVGRYRKATLNLKLAVSGWRVMLVSIRPINTAYLEARFTYYYKVTLLIIFIVAPCIL